MSKLHIKKNDTVVVLAGQDKGKTGKVLKVLVDENRALVEGVNMVSKSTKPSAKNPQGGIVKQEAPRSFLLYDATLRVLSRRLGALRNHVHTFNECAVLINQHLEHLTSLALILTGKDNDCIIFLNM